MENSGINLYIIYQNRKKEILTIAREQASIIKELNLDEIQSKGTKKGKIIEGLIKKLQSDTLNVLVLGRFSSGKSTFINALFGQAILPASPTPTTGVLCEIMYATDTEKKAILFPKPGMGRNGSDSPFEIPISNLQEELKKYVVIDNFGTSQVTSRFKKLELYYPLTLCKNDVKIIDSIGLDDPDSREKETLEYIPFIDAVLYCMKSQDTYSGVDKSVLNLLKSLKYESIFFVITRYDEIRDSVMLGEMKSEDDFKNIQYKNLAPWTELDKQGIMFVDSRSALKGKVQKDENLIELSGIRKVEKSLEAFLVQEKGRAKLFNALLSLKEANRSTRKIIPSRVSMLQADIEELENRYKSAQMPLKTLELQHQVIIRKIDDTISEIAEKAYDMADSYTTELIPKINKWSSEYEIKSKIEFPPNGDQVKAIVSEVVNYLKEKIEEDAINWNNNKLSPMIEENFKEIIKSLEIQYRDFIESTELIRAQISKGGQFVKEMKEKRLNSEETTNQEEGSLTGRLVPVSGKLLTDDFISGEMGVYEIKSMLNALILEILAGSLLSLLGLLNPVTFVITAISAILGGGLLKLSSFNDGIKKSVGEKLAEEIRKHHDEICGNAENKVKESFVNYRTRIDAELTGEISSLQNEVEKILKDRESGKLNIEEEIKKLKDFEQKNNSVEEKLDVLLCEAGINEKLITPYPIQVSSQV